MQSRISSVLFIILAGLVSIGFAQEAVTSVEKSILPGQAEKTVPSFPYVAEITADNIYIRSGPGTNYYSCGKLNKTDRVEVVGSQFSWSRIVPPAASFSWISKQYISIDPDNPNTGIVTGDNVRVYVGSDYREPIHSEIVQLKLNKGDKVTLMGEERSDYYKIVPPASAYLWVSTQYTKPLGPVGEVPIAAKPKIEPTAETAAVVPTKLSIEATKLKEYYALEKQLQAQQAKPIPQQNYTNIKKQLADIANNKEASKAARYAQFAAKKIERFELALAVDKEVQLQNEQLQQILQRIEKIRTAKLAEVKDLGRFTVVGQFQTSSVYGPQAQLKHYRIIDDSGKTACYALPTGQAVKMDLDKFIGRKVGLLGSIEPHPQTAGALLRFTEITELK